MKKTPLFLLLFFIILLVGCQYNNSEKAQLSRFDSPIANLYWGISYEDAFTSLGLNENEATVNKDSADVTREVTPAQTLLVYGKEATVTLQFATAGKEGKDGTAMPPIGLYGMIAIFEEDDITQVLTESLGKEGKPYGEDLYGQMGAKALFWQGGQIPGEISDPALLSSMKNYNREGKSLIDSGEPSSWESVKDQGSVQITLITSSQGEPGSRLEIQAEQAAAMKVLSQ